MKVLGIDYGEKRIGLALGDTESGVAAPWQTLALGGDRPHARDIARIVEDEIIGTVVVGLPLTLRGEEGPQAKAVREFIDELHLAIGAPIETVDERMTSQFADRFADAYGHQFDRDALSAAAILQTYLDRLSK